MPRCLEGKIAVRFSKQDAATLQIDQSIECLFANSLIPAITLAAAAEDSMPATENSEEVLVDLIRTQGPRRIGLSQKEVMDLFNKIRNWLKHHQPDQPEFDIQQGHAVFMILRAYTKFTSVYGNDAATPTMEAFEAWFRQNYRHWLGPEDEASRGEP
jgi:hypothetical protein